MIRLFIIGLLFLLPITTYSKEPSVAPVKSSGIQQGQSNKSAQKSEPNNRGTDRSPIFIKIIPSDPTHEQAEQEKNDKLAPIWSAVAASFAALSFFLL